MVIHTIKNQNLYYFQCIVYDSFDDEEDGEEDGIDDWSEDGAEEEEVFTQSVGSSFNTFSGNPDCCNLFVIELYWSWDKLFSTV